MSLSTLDQGSGLGKLALRWLPPLLVLLAVVGIIAIVPTVASDEGDREWYRGILGGSELYKLNVVFARLVPFLAGGALALGLLQRRLLKAQETHTADSLQRHGWTEVITHWLNAVGFILGLATSVFLLKWIDNPLTLYQAYVVHFFGAGMSLAAVSHHVAYQLVGGGFGLIPRSRADLKNALAELVSYTGVYRGVRGVFGVQLPPSARRPFQSVLRRFDIVPDPAGKYLATEKVISYPVWAVLVGIVVITGVIKAFHYLYALPGWLRQATTFLHDGATIFLLVMLVLHVSALVLVPHNWQLLKSMFTTRVSRRYAQERLPLWVEAETAEDPAHESRS
ncbi:MAG TPA: cytochrome b/b6 domain-containing protein [Dehalococcoidia bacterium]|nr:cytochrome b/b6 domain-containing protein [Dehalococcoidia bacterium]